MHKDAHFLTSLPTLDMFLLLFSFVLPHQNFKNIVESNFSSFFMSFGSQVTFRNVFNVPEDQSNHPYFSLNILYLFYLNIWFLQNALYYKECFRYLASFSSENFN